MVNTIPITDKAECVKALTEQLDKMPADVLRYISGAVDMAGMLDATKNEPKQAS